MHKYDWSNKERFLLDWGNAKSKSDFLRKKSLTSTSGNYATLSKWIELHTNNTPNDYVLNYQDIFIENSICSTQHIKRIIRDDNLLPYCCNKCSNKGFWNEQPLTLQLEHKNGNNTDHRLSNLEFLCPNCHSQTNTYGSKNLHSRFFLARLPHLLKFKIIDNNSIIKLAELWKLQPNSVKSWLSKYRNKLLQHNIKLDENIITDYVKKPNKKICSRIKLINIMREKRLEDVEIYKNDNNIVQKLSVKWNVSRHAVRQWIDRNYANLNNIKNEENKLRLKINKPINDASRIQQASILSNKKEVPELANMWNMTSEGAKKWIRHNMPEKFAEIYDDSLLEKNKKLAVKKIKADEFANLTLETFNLDELMKEYDTNKSGIYSLINLYNQSLYIALRPPVQCIICDGPTRTCGIKTNKTQYRCVDKLCGKSFYR